MGWFFLRDDEKEMPGQKEANVKEEKLSPPEHPRTAQIIVIDDESSVRTAPAYKKGDVGTGEKKYS